MLFNELCFWMKERTLLINCNLAAARMVDNKDLACNATEKKLNGDQTKSVCIDANKHAQIVSDYNLDIKSAHYFISHLGYS